LYPHLLWSRARPAGLFCSSDRQLHAADWRTWLRHGFVNWRPPIALRMGRGNALPKSFFGVIEPEAAGAHATISLRSDLWRWLDLRCCSFSRTGGGWGGGAYEIGAESFELRRFCCLHGRKMRPAFVHHLRHEKSSSLGGYIVPALGFVICGFIWVHLSNPALGARRCMDDCRYRLWRNSHARLPL